MEHPTPDAQPERTAPDAELLPEPRHHTTSDRLPPLIGSAPPRPTLPADAGRPIVPSAGGRGRDERVNAPWVPGAPWRPGGSVHGHDRPQSEAEPLTRIGPPGTPRSMPADRLTVHSGGPEPRAQRRLAAVAVTGFAAALLGAALALGGAAGLGAFDDPEPVVAPPVSIPPAVQITEIVTDGATTPASAVGLKVRPSIVTVEVGGTDIAGDFNAVGSGSGVVLSADGAIATNHHVVADADAVRVIFQDGRIYAAEVVGSDQLTDLAVLRIDGNGLVPVERGSTADLVIGDTAIAVGNPLGLSGGASLTVGVVSAFDREVIVGPGTADRLFGMLQTDAPITNGSSGGALVDGRGRLIGITTAIGVSEAGAEGIGFAIPVELVVRITDELIERGNVRHAFLGVGLRDFLQRDGAAQFPAGATISTVEPDSSADTYGLLVGDRIVAVDEEAVLTTQDVINTLRLYRVGDVARVRVIRDGASMTIDVELGERPEGI